jgi:hypothetical protein
MTQDANGNNISVQWDPIDKQGGFGYAGGDKFLNALGLTGKYSEGQEARESEGGSTPAVDGFIDPSLNGYQVGQYNYDGNSQAVFLKDANGNIVKQGLIPRGHSSFTGSDYADALKTYALAAGAGFGVNALAGGLGGAGAGAGEALSGMDLAADAALGTGNNIATAGSMLGGGSSAGIGALAGNADKAALYGDAGYGTGMSGAETAAYDAALPNATDLYSHEGANYSGPNGLDPVTNSPINAVPPTPTTPSDYSNEGKNYSGPNGLDPATNAPVNVGSAASSGIGSQLLDFAKANPKLATYITSAILGKLLGKSNNASSAGIGAMGGGKQSNLIANSAPALNTARSYNSPPKGYRPGFDPQWNYFNGIGALGTAPSPKPTNTIMPVKQGAGSV